MTLANFRHVTAECSPKAEAPVPKSPEKNAPATSAPGYGFADPGAIYPPRGGAYEFERPPSPQIH